MPVTTWLTNNMKHVNDKVDEHQTEVKTWRQEDLAKTSSLATTVETLTTKIQDLAARVAKLDGTAPPPDPDGVNSSVSPQNPTPCAAQSGGSRRARGHRTAAPVWQRNPQRRWVLHHSSDLFPKKPFDEVLNLKTAHSSSSSSGSSTDSMVPRFFKLDFPHYDGKDLLPWLSRCEQFFRAQRTEPPQKIWLATFHLDGDAFHWYVHLEHSRDMPSWEEFRELFSVQFGPPIRSNHLGELRLLRQTGTVADYISRFLALLSHANPSDREVQQMFTANLSNDIRVDVELQGPRDLEHACALARAYEKKVGRPSDAA
jgi:hypothetical protein